VTIPIFRASEDHAKLLDDALAWDKANGISHQTMAQRVAFWRAERMVRIDRAARENPYHDHEGKFTTAEGDAGARPEFKYGEALPWAWKGSPNGKTEEDRYRAMAGWQETFTGSRWIRDHPDSPAAIAFAAAVAASPLVDGPVYKGVSDAAGSGTQSPPIGSTVTFERFASTTPSKDVAWTYAMGSRNTLFEFEGAKAHDISKYASSVVGETVMEPGKFVVDSSRTERDLGPTYVSDDGTVKPMYMGPKTTTILTLRAVP
jgi:hypothetical protein